MKRKQLFFRFFRFGFGVICGVIIGLVMNKIAAGIILGIGLGLFFLSRRGENK